MFRVSFRKSKDKFRCKQALFRDRRIHKDTTCFNLENLEAVTIHLFKSKITRKEVKTYLIIGGNLSTETSMSTLLIFDSMMTSTVYSFATPVAIVKLNSSCASCHPCFLDGDERLETTKE